MISTRKQQLVITAVLACICVPAVGAEQKQAKAVLKFESSNAEVEWITNRIEGGDDQGHGPNRPTHAAELFIAYMQDFPDFFSPVVMKKILDTSAGQGLSQKQRDFLGTSEALATIRDFGCTLPNHYHFRLYAFSQDEAKKTAQAFIELLTNKANAKTQKARDYLYLKDYLHKLEEKKAKAKKELPEKEAEVKAIRAKLDEVKKTVHYRSDNEAEEAISELNKMFNTLQIEIAGIQQKLAIIGKYEADKEMYAETLRKLQQMRIEQIIELEVAEAKVRTITTLRKQAQESYELFTEYGEHIFEARRLKEVLSHYEEELPNIKEGLANLNESMLPPKIYQNKVTIYPVRVDE